MSIVRDRRNCEAIMKFTLSKPVNEAINPPRRRPRIQPVVPFKPPNEQSGSTSRRRTSPFRKVDIARAISAAQKGGATVSELEIKPDGAIRLTFAIGAHSLEERKATPYEEWAEKL